MKLRATAICCIAITLGAVTVGYLKLPGNYSGGSLNHIPPQAMAGAANLDFILETKMHGSGSSLITQRYSAVNLCYGATSGNEIKVPMTLTSSSNKKGTWHASLARGKVQASGNFHYWFELTFDSRHTKTNTYSISIQDHEN